MLNLNTVTLAGNITHEPQLHYTPSGKAVAEVSIAINRRYRDDSGQLQERTTYVNDITFWGTQAENLVKFFAKGDPIYIQGCLELDTWQDQATGKNRSRQKVIGHTWQFLTKKTDRQQSHQSDPSDQSHQSDQSDHTDQSDQARERAQQRAQNRASLMPHSLPDEPEDDTIPF